MEDRTGPAGVPPLGIQPQLPEKISRKEPLATDALKQLADLLAERLVARLEEAREKLWTEEEAAAFLRISPKTLWRMRSANEVPFLVLTGGKKRTIVRYEPTQLQTWARSGGCRSRSKSVQRVGR